MSDLIRCPHCDRKLRVPGTLLGKPVSCPSCGHRFIVEKQIPELEEVPESRPRHRPTEPEDEDEEEGRPRRQPAAEDDDDEEYEEPRPRRGRRRSARAEAESALLGPAILLMIVGVLGLAFAVYNAITVTKGGVAAHPFGPPPPGQEASYQVGLVIGMGIAFLWPIVVFFGGLMMKMLRVYPIAMSGAIFVMLPCNLVCCLGFPIGIWALIVLARPEVKAAFD